MQYTHVRLQISIKIHSNGNVKMILLILQIRYSYLHLKFIAIENVCANLISLTDETRTVKAVNA